MLRPAAGSDPQRVLVLRTLGAAPRRLVGRRRARDAPADPPAEAVATARATIIDVSPLADEAAAAAALEGGEAEVDEALAYLNVALHAHRLATADPFVNEVSAGQALVVRIGHGRGEQVADGRWDAARELPPTRPERRRRTAALRPQERLASLLGGRDAALACEELTLRARLDLDHGRPREAALGVRVALEAALVELEHHGTGASDMPRRLGELRDGRGAVGDAANAALHGPPSEEHRAAVADTLERIEAALRARTAAGV